MKYWIKLNKFDFAYHIKFQCSCPCNSQHIYPLHSLSMSIRKTHENNNRKSEKIFVVVVDGRVDNFSAHSQAKYVLCGKQIYVGSHKFVARTRTHLGSRLVYDQKRQQIMKMFSISIGNFRNFLLPTPHTYVAQSQSVATLKLYAKNIVFRPIGQC